MRNDLERYVIEVNGIAKAEYPIFVDAFNLTSKQSDLPRLRTESGSNTRGLANTKNSLIWVA